LSAQPIDGKALAAKLRARVAAAAAELKTAHGITPGLAVVLVGEDPASAVYVRSKSKAAREVGFRCFDIKHPDTLSEQELLSQIAELNGDASVNGILIQLPLPKHLDPEKIIEAIDPLKDVDGLHPLNAGRLSSGEYGVSHGLVACTPLGAAMLIREVLGSDLSGKDALVIGRSNLVGKPLAQLLLQENCTVTIAHSRTKDLPSLAARAEILVAAMGRPEMVRGDWIGEGAIVIDVGINRVVAEDGTAKLCGDVAFDEAVTRAAAITPVPGGVGPMTITMLMKNTVRSAKLHAAIK
jgi:methylenetetrahydrofolate dehydrogenase (NADP+)/methenyltetrahydrofolate cyclohydrolase